jgi:hypothetical protein
MENFYVDGLSYQMRLTIQITEKALVELIGIHHKFIDIDRDREIVRKKLCAKIGYNLSLLKFEAVENMNYEFLHYELTLGSKHLNGVDPMELVKANMNVQ